MKKILLSLLLVLGIIFVYSPNFVLAQTSSSNSQSTSDECEQLRQKFQNAGAGKLADSLPQYCTESSIFTKVTTLLYSVTGAIAVISIIYGGYVYMTAGGNEQARKKGQEILTYSIIGLMLVIFAAGIITMISKFVVDNKLF
ncbi:MAG: pilin [Candidatus Doudnabacteria bacterium]